MAGAAQNTAVELQPQSEATNRSVYSHAESSLSQTDNVLQISLLADSTVPDGGYGWYLILGCFIITFWVTGTIYSWGIIQASLISQGLSSPSTLSFVGSVSCVLIVILAIVNARVIRLLGARNTSMMGVSLVALGEILSGFATRSIGALFFTAGVIMGVGVSLCFLVTAVTPAQYFSKKRGLANSIVYAGGGLGGTVISLALNSII